MNVKEKKVYMKKYRLENAEKIEEHAKKYRFENREMLKMKGIKYYSQNREKRKQYSQDNIENRKQYRRRPGGIYSNIKSGAKIRGLKFNLSFEEYMALWGNACDYCKGVTKGYLDRVDNSKGYTKDNVVASCHECNTFKGAKTKKEFLVYCEV